jgi:hypothetical protein
MRVAICANGISDIRSAAVRIATSPVPPRPMGVSKTAHQRCLSDMGGAALAGPCPAAVDSIEESAFIL